MCFPNTYVHTLNKKNFFFRKSIIKKNKGGGTSPSGGKRTFWGRQKFLAEDPKIWPNETFWANRPPSVAVLNLNQKQKSYGALKSGNSKFWKNRLPPPFEMKQPLRNPFTWHANALHCLYFSSTFQKIFKMKLSNLMFFVFQN